MTKNRIRRVVTKLDENGACVSRDEDLEFEALQKDVEDLKDRVVKMEDLIYASIKLMMKFMKGN